ncbi:Dirigent protein [Quillaja saponaria]|uniref:Dirigent protein n=1 Tax=Quillaja saponaria TaxID=32244 RepID=A0AAD7KQT1_QUISA|nr:Dirigent protein [Quillaja saponaria]
MDLSLQNYVFAAILVLTIIPFKASSNSNSLPHHQHHELKSLHFTLFDHEILNKTAFRIVSGVAGAGYSATTTPFGTLFVVNDPFKLSADPSSKVVGSNEGFSLTSSLDGLENIAVGKLSLNLKKYKGAVYFVGSVHNTKSSEHPIVGGTGDFLFVQGYITTSPVNLTGLILIYKFEFHLYWPPYAAQIS